MGSALRHRRSRQRRRHQPDRPVRDRSHCRQSHHHRRGWQHGHLHRSQFHWGRSRADPHRRQPGERYRQHRRRNTQCVDRPGRRLSGAGPYQTGTRWRWRTHRDQCFLRRRHTDAAGTPQRHRRRGGRCRVLPEHAALRCHARGAEFLFFARRRADPVRCQRQPPGLTRDTHQAGRGRSRWREHHLFRLHAGEGWHHRCQYRWGMRQRSQLSELLRHLGGGTACRRRRGAAAAVQSGRAAGNNLQRAGRDRRCDGIHDPQ